MDRQFRMPVKQRHLQEMVRIQLERQPAMDIVVTVPQEILARMEDMETPEEDMEVTDTYCEEVL